MAKNIDFMGAIFPDVPSIRLPQQGGGLVSFDDTTDADAVASDIAQGKTAYVNGTKVVGTASGSVTVDPLSVTQNGTYTAQTGHAYSPVTVNVSGGGGLVYETGTWTPSENVASYWISFNNTHSVAPFYYMIADVSASYNSANNANLLVTYSNMEQALGAPVNGYNETTKHYGIVVYQYRGSTGSLSYGRINLVTSASDPTDANNSNSRYWTTETGFRIYTVSSSRHWLSTRTYKWIAVWAPTT